MPRRSGRSPKRTRTRKPGSGRPPSTSRGWGASRRTAWSPSMPAKSGASSRCASRFPPTRPPDGPDPACYSLSWRPMANDPREKEDREGDLATEKKRKVEKIRPYKVVLHNDDYTTMEFVVHV